MGKAVTATPRCKPTQRKTRSIRRTTRNTVQQYQRGLIPVTQEMVVMPPAILDKITYTADAQDNKRRRTIPLPTTHPLPINMTEGTPTRHHDHTTAEQMPLQEELERALLPVPAPNVLLQLRTMAEAARHRKQEITQFRRGQTIRHRELIMPTGTMLSDGTLTTEPLHRGQMVKVVAKNRVNAIRAAQGLPLLPPFRSKIKHAEPSTTNQMATQLESPDNSETTSAVSLLEQEQMAGLTRETTADTTLHRITGRSGIECRLTKIKRKHDPTETVSDATTMTDGQTLASKLQKLGRADNGRSDGDNAVAAAVPETTRSPNVRLMQALQEAENEQEGDERTLEDQQPVRDCPLLRHKRKQDQVMVTTRDKKKEEEELKQRQKRQKQTEQEEKTGSSRNSRLDNRVAETEMSSRNDRYYNDIHDYDKQIDDS